MTALPLTPPPTPPQATSVPEAQIWDPSATLQIYNPQYHHYFTCPCDTLKNKRCTKSATQKNVERAKKLVTQLACVDPTSKHIEPKLREIAALTLCKHPHRKDPGNHDKVVGKWLTKINSVISTDSIDHLSESARSSVNVSFRPRMSIQTSAVENSSHSLKNSKDGLSKQKQQNASGLLDLYSIAKAIELEYNRLLNDISQRDEQILQLRQQLEKRKIDASRRHLKAARDHEWHDEQEQTIKESLGNEVAKETQRLDELHTERERRESEEQRCRELEEEIGAEKKASARRELEMQAKHRKLEYKLRQEREARQRLQQVFRHQNATHRSRQARHRQEQQRLQQRLERVQDTMQLLQDFTSRQQEDLDRANEDLNRAHRELARRFRDSHAGHDPRPPDTTATSFGGRLRRIVQKRSE